METTNFSGCAGINRGINVNFGKFLMKKYTQLRHNGKIERGLSKRYSISARCVFMVF